MRLAGSLPFVPLITIIIPCHNYARYLGECLQSIEQSLPPSFPAEKVKVIVIDDASDDPDETQTVAMIHGVECRRVEFRNQAKSCQYGFSLVDSKYCMFLDADDKLHPEFLTSAVRIMEQDRNCAFVFPWLDAFGDRTGPAHGTQFAPERITATDIEARNWCPASSLFRTQILHQTLAMKFDRNPQTVCNDWITARNVLRGGAWYALKSEFPLYYRMHSGEQQHVRAADSTYFEQADLQNETVTIVIAFSGRWDCWERLKQWLDQQSWPLKQTRLMILNSTHSPLSAANFGLDNWAGAGLQIERIDNGFPGLADIDRRDGNPAIAGAVEAAVSGLYNRAIQMIPGEWVFFLEDDVIPHRRDTIEKLMQSVDMNVAAVSGLYKHRYEDAAVAFSVDGITANLKPLDGNEDEIEHVDGTGFGCLLMRRSVLVKHPMAGDSDRKFFDVDVTARITAWGWRWLLDRAVKCDHLVKVEELPEPPEPTPQTEVQILGEITPPEVRNPTGTNCRHLGPVVETNLCTCGAQIHIHHCQRQNMNAVKLWIDEERELDRRHSSPAEKVTAKELKQILAVCEKCVLFENPL